VPPTFQALANTKEHQMKQDRVVVITGAAGGMGSVLVERFLANGDTVIATDTKDEGLEALCGGYLEGGRLRQTRRRCP
jgi:NAD(P)-dependent dehydrogenase (short-subunit alcohol dehydrogenase family)